MAILRTYAPRLAVLALSVTVSYSASAQNLDMSGVSAGSDDGRPSAGMSENSVEAKYGAPVNKISPVGDPPIARWEYPEFIVYFEYDKVIHAVKRR
ncbi:MAG TPA: hypothetical protein PKK10_02065 [Woeseiaceae bacterium]|nr:hypothetical protein [Woeseiaceae bacterium]